ncbi:hypothetical protein DPMN_033757 [Dreissena polymorpha]|uniref:Uncharacterized protein n=1 Tax=Dreissena polymorpha TaxID=45954 RepID=A0A9D4RJF2_DREPO|nr:hypothetical protein DPMN_033757 [Dreissena polymorpha]
MSRNKSVKARFCQGKVSEKSGNFISSGLWQPLRGIRPQAPFASQPSCQISNMSRPTPTQGPPPQSGPQTNFFPGGRLA